MTFTYNIHNVLKIQSDVRLMNYAFHKYFLSDETDDPDIIIRIAKDIEKPKGLSRHDRWFYGKEGGDLVYYEDNLLGMNDKVLVKNIKEKPTEIIVTKSVLKFTPRSRGSLSDLIEAIIDLKLSKTGFATLHAGTLSKNGLAVVLTGFPNVGKTLCTLYLLKNGFKYMGDDNGMIDKDGNVYCYPSTSSIGYHDFLKFIEPDDIGRFRYYMHLLRVLPMRVKIVERLFNYPEIYLPDIKRYGQEDKAKAKVVCCLEIGEMKIREISREKMVKKIEMINDYSRPRPTQNPFLWIYAYFNTDFNLHGFVGREEEIISSFLKHCKCFVISCNERNWGEVLEEVLKGEIS